MINIYGSIKLLDIEANELACWDVSGATHVRVTMPASPSVEIKMQKQGYLFVDRTLKTTISISSNSIDFNKMIRCPLAVTKGYKDDIFRIACSSFPYDRRFNILPECNRFVSEIVLQDWIYKLDNVIIALFKDKVIGFLSLVQNSHDSLYINLAAVESKYRISGAAISLYAKACQIAKETGIKRIEGRISSLNSSVMNIYSALGAKFSEPYDIFLKEVQNDS